MNIKNIKAYIRLGTDYFQTRKKNVKDSISCGFIGIALGAWGFFYDSTTRCYSVAACILACVAIIYSAMMPKRLNLRKRILYMAVDSLFNSVMFIFDCAIFLYMLKVPYHFLIFVAPVLGIIFGFSFAIIWIKKEKYIKYADKEPNYAVISTVGGIGGGIGFTIAKVTDINNSALYIMLSIVLWLISSVFSLGVQNFLKLHYIKVIKSHGYSIGE